MAKTNIMLMATAWGPRCGGINAFNRDFAIGLAKALGDRGSVFCAVLDPSPGDETDASTHGVTLVPVCGKGNAQRFDTAWPFEINSWLRKKHGDPPIDWWVGHDIISGQAALAGPQIAERGRTAFLSQRRRPPGSADVRTGPPTVLRQAQDEVASWK
jgi:hypothetical protein